jgi:hypothetical protein
MFRYFNSAQAIGLVENQSDWYIPGTVRYFPAITTFISHCFGYVTVYDVKSLRPLFSFVDILCVCLKAKRFFVYTFFVFTMCHNYWFTYLLTVACLGILGFDSKGGFF